MVGTMMIGYRGLVFVDGWVVGRYVNFHNLGMSAYEACLLLFLPKSAQVNASATRGYPHQVV